MVRVIGLRLGSGLGLGLGLRLAYVAIGMCRVVVLPAYELVLSRLVYDSFSIVLLLER
jgi:hypothetical protein